MRLDERLEAIIGRRPTRVAPLAGGCVAEVARAFFDDGSSLVVKSASAGGLECEGWMLGYLAVNSRLPVPPVVYSDDRLLVIEHITNDGGGALTPMAETRAAEMLAELHAVTASCYGLERDTVIGGLHQPNPRASAWCEFFRDHRLRCMAERALRVGRLPPATFDRLEKLCARLGEWIGEPAGPSLIHGDVWGGNVLVCGDEIAGFVDPAIYYADAEIELAFSTLFSTFGEAFFGRYSELRPIAPGFFEARRDIYNLYPLLVHTLLFGAGYARSVDATLVRLVG